MTKSMKRIHGVTVRYIVDKDPDTSYLEQDEFEDRKRQFDAGLFSFIGIAAEAMIQVHPTDSALAPVQTVCSGGLWGIEDDSDKSYLQEVEAEQLAELREQLWTMGFSSRAISAAFKDVQHGT